MSYSALYGLFALSSLLLFNALILLSRYVQQTKRPPEDSDYESLITQNNQLEAELQKTQREVFSLQSDIEGLKEEKKKVEGWLKAAADEVESLKKNQFKTDQAAGSA